MSLKIIIHAVLGFTIWNGHGNIRYTDRIQHFVLPVVLEQNLGDGRRPSPGWEKSLMAVQKKKDDPNCIVGSRAAA